MIKFYIIILYQIKFLYYICTLIYVILLNIYIGRRKYDANLSDLILA